MNTKICVYAICKNEITFVNRWLESMSEADYIVVLDTGSTDGTYEKLKADPRVKVEQKIIDPWRFDVARNESMKLVPDDASCLVCTDLDEVFESGWTDILRRVWGDGGYLDACVYTYVWSHDAQGRPERTSWYSKIHNRNWEWRYPVHETLEPLIPADQVRTLNAEGHIILHHYPDASKPRTESYLSLVELRKQEFPEDRFAPMYLQQLYWQFNMNDKGVKICEEVMDRWRDELPTREKVASYSFKGLCYRDMHRSADAIKAWKQAIEIDPSYIEPYYFIMEEAWKYKDKTTANKIADGCIEKGSRYQVHFYMGFGDVDLYKMIATIYYYSFRMEDALVNITKAWLLQPNRSDVLELKSLIETKILAALEQRAEASSLSLSDAVNGG